jgi:hypothetical protein
VRRGEGIYLSAIFVAEGCVLLNHSLSGFDSNKSICVTSVYKILSLFYILSRMTALGHLSNISILVSSVSAACRR